MLQIKTTIPLDHQMNRSATQKIAVISETVLEYSMVDESSETEHTATYPSQSRVGVDVGGHLFVTSRVTLRKLLTSGLAMLYSRQWTNLCPRLTTSCVYRDHNFFDIFLHFYRNGHHNINCHLSFAFFVKFIKSRVLLHRLSNRFYCERMCYSSYCPRGVTEESKKQYSIWKLWLWSDLIIIFFARFIWNYKQWLWLHNYCWYTYIGNKM